MFDRVYKMEVLNDFDFNMEGKVGVWIDNIFWLFFFLKILDIL